MTKADGLFRLALDYFDYCTRLTMTNAREELLTPASYGSASVEAVTEDVVLRLTRSLAAETKMKNLILAGGLACRQEG